MYDFNLENPLVAVNAQHQDGTLQLELRRDGKPQTVSFSLNEQPTAPVINA